MNSRVFGSFKRLLVSNNRKYIYQKNNYNLINCWNFSTFLVGLDGTSYGYLGLVRAFKLANTNDKIIGLHIPVDPSEFAYEYLMYPEFENRESSHLQAFEKRKEDFINKLKNKCDLIANKLKNDSNKNINFSMMIGDDSISIKQDLVDACDEFEVDYLVLGCKGRSHSLTEKIEKKVVEMLGSVPDYCVHNANCSVLVCKPKEGETMQFE